MPVNTTYKQSDSENALLRKILDRLNDSVSINTTAPISVGTVSDTIADGADVAQGAKADAAATDSTSAWTLVSLLKGIWAKLAGTLTVGGTVTVQQATAASLKVSLADTGANATAIKVDGSAVTQPVSGNVGGKTTVIKDTTAVTASAYTAGNAVGGKRTLANALTAVGTGILESIIILDRANQKAPLDIFIFDADPTNATITDKSAFVFSTDDLKVIAHVSVAAADYVTVNSKAVAHESSLGIALKASGTSLYAAVVTSGTPTYAATSDVQITFGILQD